MGVTYTVEVTSAVYATPRKSLPWCMQHRGSHFRDVCYTAEATSTVLHTPQKFCNKNNKTSAVYATPWK
ncbi:MAG: hypothetical protein FJ333_09820 [Sphingomonadales bacterium]|nr:hypothetical protein [Sphingomonadales bacterium]